MTNDLLLNIKDKWREINSLNIFVYLHFRKEEQEFRMQKSTFLAASP